MKTWLIWVLVTFTIISTLGLIYVQVQWVYSAVSSEREVFNHTIANAIYTVSDIVEEEELLLHIARFEHIETSLIDSLERHYATIDFARIPRKTYVDILVKHFPDTCDKKLANMENLSLAEQYLFVKSLFSLLVKVNASIEQRVSSSQLQRLLDNEFQRNNINVPYEFAVLDSIGNIVLQSDGYTAASPAKEYHTVKLFRSDMDSNGDYYLTVYIPHKSSYIVRSIELLIYITLALTIIVVVLFSIILFIIFRQKRLSEIKDDFVSNITHELKTPIATISLAGQMLSDPSTNDKPDRVASLSNIVTDETKRLSILVEKILQMSAIEQGKIRLRKKDIDMHALAKKVLANFSLQFSTEGVTVFTDFRATQAHVFGDETHLLNTLSNLIDNAIKYRNSAVPLQLHIKTENNGTNFEITISDNGVGVAPEHLKRIFEKFYRVPNKNVHNIKGFGLGLNYAREIIAMHNGTLWVRSELQKGSTFGITLPITKY